MESRGIDARLYRLQAWGSFHVNASDHAIGHNGHSTMPCAGVVKTPLPCPTDIISLLTPLLPQVPTPLSFVYLYEAID